MKNEFPVLEITKQAGKQVLAFPKGIAITVAFYVLTIVLMVGVVFGALNGDFSFLEKMQAGDVENLSNPIRDGWGWIIFFSLILVMVGYSWLFNFWIRFGALGKDGAFMPTFGSSLSAAGVTAVKLFFITLLLLIVAMVVLLMLTAFGVVSLDEVEPSLSGALITNLVLLGAISSIYSVFSSNLTQTALGSDKEEVGPPQVFEFGVVLFVLNILVMVPLVFLQLFTHEYVASAYNLLGTLWLTAAIPLAHGIRYDWQRQTFVGESAAEQFKVSDESDDDQ